MGGSDDRRLTVHGTSGNKNMSVTGTLHRDSRLRKTLYIEPNRERSATVDEQSRNKTTTSEHMVQCKYK